MTQSSSLVPAPARVEIHPLGDRALVVEIDAPVEARTVDYVRCIDERLRTLRLAGVKECVPAFCSLTVHYDPQAVLAGAKGAREALAFDLLRARIEAALPGVEAVPAGQATVIEIPVCYGGDHGEDLAPLALGRGLSAEEFIALHTQPTYFVGMIGFLPGFPYLGGLDERLVAPRRTTPRSEVPAGSVAIGGQHTGIYTFPSPGGWHLIGRTPLRLFDLRRDPPSLLATGDRVRFVAIPPEAYERLAEPGR